jgi:hypothetical protein
MMHTDLDSVLAALRRDAGGVWKIVFHQGTLYPDYPSAHEG